MKILSLLRKKKTISIGLLVAKPVAEVKENQHVICDLGSAIIIRHNEHPNRVLLKLPWGQQIIRPKLDIYDLGVYIDGIFHNVSKSQYNGLLLNVGDIVEYTITNDRSVKIKALESHPKQVLRAYSPDGSLERQLSKKNIIIIKLKDSAV